MNIGDFTGYEKNVSNINFKYSNVFKEKQITIYQLIKNFKQHQCNRKDNIGRNQ